MLGNVVAALFAAATACGAEGPAADADVASGGAALAKADARIHEEEEGEPEANAADAFSPEHLLIARLYGGENSTVALVTTHVKNP